MYYNYINITKLVSLYIYSYLLTLHTHGDRHACRVRIYTAYLRTVY